VVRCFHHENAHQLSLTGSGAVPAKLDLDAPPALHLHDLAISYRRAGLVDKVLGRDSAGVPTVDGIEITVAKGETLGLVGESGSGKSTILKAIAGLLPPSGGKITVVGGNALAPEAEQRIPDHLRKIQLIFQNPDDSLNPRQTIAQILEQPLKLYFGLMGDALHQRSAEILDRVRLGAHYLDRLPSQLSGGEKQRVAIARAFAAEPDLVLCDEVTSALDVSVQAAVLDLLNDLKATQGTTYVFVSHDLAVVRALSDRVAVLYQGRLCELGLSADAYATPSHPYTEVLLGAVLEPDPDTAPTLSADDVVELSPPAQGCPFQRRCPRRIGRICDTDDPPWQQGAKGHAIKCHHSIADLATAQAEDAAGQRA
jgi:peptide/nickel transport system ATP-binding protein